MGQAGEGSDGGSSTDPEAPGGTSSGTGSGSGEGLGSSGPEATTATASGNDTTGQRSNSRRFDYGKEYAVSKPRVGMGLVDAMMAAFDGVDALSARVVRP